MWNIDYYIVRELKFRDVQKKRAVKQFLIKLDLSAENEEKEQEEAAHSNLVITN